MTGAEAPPNKSILEAKGMKNDLICQSSEFDCGPTCVTNAMRFLFEREEIPPCVLKHIWTMGIDTYPNGGETGKMGTSKASMRYMAAWFNCYANGCHFPVHTEFLELEDARIHPGSRTWACLERGGCAVMRCSTGGIGHYVLLTGILPGGEIGLFDPYDEEPEFTEPGRRVVSGCPKAMNRAVRSELLNLMDQSDYAMGPLEQRENLLFWREGGQEAAEP